MAAKKTATKKRTTTKKAAKPKGVGAVALVVRVPPAAMEYIDGNRGDRPRTVFLREVLAKGDAKLGKALGAE